MLSVLPYNDSYAAGVFPIGTTAGREAAFSMASDGTNYLVGIQGDASGFARITAQMVGPTGALIGSRIDLGTTGGTPRVAFDGTDYLMIWQDDSPLHGEILRGQLVTRNGTLVGAAFDITALPTGQEIFGLVWGVGSYLVLYFTVGTGNSPLYSRLISPSGTVSGATYVGTAGSPSGGGVNSITFGGPNHLISWTDLFGSPSANLRFRFFGPDGQTLGPEFSMATPPTCSTLPRTPSHPTRR